MISLPTVRFRTDFDPERIAVPVPIRMSSGGHPAAAVVDALVRGDGIVGRFEAESGLVGLAVAGDGRDLSVEVALAADDRTGLGGPGRGTYPPRLLLVRSQGRTRAVALLGRRPGDFTYRARARARFTVPAAELPPGGLLTVEVTGAAGELPGSPAGASGVRLDAIAVTPVVGSGAGTAAVDGGRAETVEGLAVVAPGTGPQWRLRVRRVRPVPPDPNLPPLGPPWRRPRTGEPELRMREKIVLIVKQRSRKAARQIRLLARHVVARAVRVADPPVAMLLSARLRRDARRGRLHADIVPLSPGPERVASACEVRYMGWSTISVTPMPGITPQEWALLHVSAPARRFRYAWRLLDGPAG